MRLGRAVRISGVVLGVLVMLAGAAAITYRALSPHETLTRAKDDYPNRARVSGARPYSELRSAPLVLDGRLRVYADKRRVWTDAPVGAHYESTPYWSYRRWPAEVVGVVAAVPPSGPVVVSQWSDGQLVALDARTGEIAWRTTVPISDRAYDGRRTGASVVYQPRSLLTVRAASTVVLVVTGPGVVQAFDIATGDLLWQRQVGSGATACEPAAWTGAELVAVPACSGGGVTVVSAIDGRERSTWDAPGRTGGTTVGVQLPKGRPPAPALCELGRSECRLVNMDGRTWLLGPKAKLTAVPPLEKGARLAGEYVVYPTKDGVAARRLTSRNPLWTWTGEGRLIAADAQGVYLLTPDHVVLGLNPQTGRLALIGCAWLSTENGEGWELGHVYATGIGYLALERINKVPSTAKDSLYYYGPRPVALVALYPPTKLPLWLDKFAAGCLQG